MGMTQQYFVAQVYASWLAQPPLTRWPPRLTSLRCCGSRLVALHRAQPTLAQRVLPHTTSANLKHLLEEFLLRKAGLMPLSAVASDNLTLSTSRNQLQACQKNESEVQSYYAGHVSHKLTYSRANVVLPNKSRHAQASSKQTCHGNLAYEPQTRQDYIAVLML